MNKEGMEEVNGNYNNTAKVFNSSQKPLRYSRDSFVKELIGKRIRISLITQEIFEGILKQLGMFDIDLEIRTTQNIKIAGKEMTRETTKSRIFMKSSIIWVEVM